VVRERRFPKGATHEFRAPQHLHVRAFQYFAAPRFDRIGLARRPIEIDPGQFEFSVRFAEACN
jgi:hypothetical protein